MLRFSSAVEEAARLRIERDEPGRALVLARRGRPQFLGRRVLLTVFLAVFWLALLPLIGSLLAGIDRLTWSGLVAALLVLAVWYGIVGFLTYQAGQFYPYLARIAVTPAGVETVYGGRHLFWLSRRERIDRAAVHAMHAVVTESDAGPRIELAVSGRESDPLRGASFTVELVDGREEAVDLAFRAARVLGIETYRVTRSDPRVLELDLGDAPGASPIPERAGPADYAATASVPDIATPPTAAPPFDPASLFVRSVRPIATWQPATLVRIFIPKTPAALLVLFGFVSAAIVVLVVTWNIDVGWPARLAAIVAIGLALTYYSSLAFQEREVVLDWTRNEARFRRGSSSRTFALDGAREVVLRGWSSRIPASRLTPAHETYRCDAELPFATGTGLILSTDQSLDPDIPYRQMLAFVIELAGALGVPWRWAAYATPSPGGAILNGRA